MYENRIKDGIYMRFGYCSNLNFMINDDPRGKEIFEGILAAAIKEALTVLKRYFL